MIICMYDTVATRHTRYRFVLNRPQIKTIFHKEHVSVRYEYAGKSISPGA